MGAKEEAKEVILKLIELYDKVVASGRLKKYTEEETKKDFILPLFRALGWNMEDSSEVSAEEQISKGRVDYGFRINGIPKFFLEAKSLKENLMNEKFVRQSVNYSWHKGCTWAILCDFEGVRVFNAEWKYSNPLQSHFMTINHTDFIERFEDLWLLSRESFEQGALDKKAEKYGKKAKKIPVDKQLLSDFTRFRELLSKSIMKDTKNRKLIEKEEDLDEAIQRILDRLIFIRNCEDRKLESKKLIPAMREWRTRKKGALQKEVDKIFKYFDEEYNSKIFAKHLCDQVVIEDKALVEVIVGLYRTKDETIYYNFAAIEADTLGNIYEQYLGHILSKTDKRAKVTEAKGKRKAQGIYYTPTYIVDYIVRNTLGELLKKKKPKDIENLRVLDPACGSGSFLIKAFDVLNEHYTKDKSYTQTTLDVSGGGVTYSRKLKILKNNIFGVDLDKQAVEIAQLNLLLKVAEKGHRLPVLQENIKNGNSLIDNPEIASEKAFTWNEEFDEVMKEGGFDVIIGNPPYVRNDSLSKDEKNTFMSEYFSAKGKFDLYLVFIEKAIRLLKDGGLMGFIVPSKFMAADYGKKIREYVLKECKILQIVDVSHLPVFQNVATYPCIIIFQKTKEDSLKHKIKIADKIADKDLLIDLKKEFVSLPQKKYQENNSQIFTLVSDNITEKIISKIKNK
jgi:type I restriction-modification system DNA methylase subunit